MAIKIEDEIRSRCIQQYLSGITIAEISKRNQVSRSSIHKWVKASSYTGTALLRIRRNRKRRGFKSLFCLYGVDPDFDF